MASSRARRILSLISPTSQIVDNDVPDHGNINHSINDVIMSASNCINTKENISPCSNTQSNANSSAYCEEIDPFDDTDDCMDRDCQVRLQLNSNEVVREMTFADKIITHKNSLVPDYDSDDSLLEDKISHENNMATSVGVGLTKSIPSSCSSSSSSSTSSSSSSSSDSDSSSSSVKSSVQEPSKDVSTFNKKSCNEDTEVTKHVDGTGALFQPTDKRNDEPSNQRLREVRGTEERSYNISPIFTDESDIDLSDDDPSYNAENMLNKHNKTRNFLFDQTNIASSLLSSSGNETSSDSDNSNIKKKSKNKGRKRTKNPATWKQNQVKKLRNTGESYTSLSSSHKNIPSRCLKVPCTDKCKLKCTEGIDTDSRYKIFKEFWDLGDLNKQRAYINKCMVDITPKYRYTNADNPRRFNKAYYLTLNMKKIRVCKTFFKSTLDISDRMIFTIQTKISEGGVLLEDLRGKHGHHKKIKPELLDDIRKHIDSIPRIESHYTRATSSKQYIDGGKTIKDLYNDFAEQQKSNGKELGNYIAYYKIFTTEFNLGFFSPKKDQCDFCLSYHNSTDEKKKELEEKYSIHVEEKELSRIEKQNDCKNVSKDHKVVIYDLEAVLQSPKGDTSSFYYKSKLNSYNLTCTELTKANSKTAYDIVHCYFWTECDAKRGAVEIGTCVWQYLDGLCKENPEEKNIIFYSDNCCGQNKNKFITSLYMFAVQFLNIKTITHKFLIRGHTQNEADGVHSLIEKEIKKNLRSGPIYSPDQYIALIKNAKKSKPSINVHEMTFESFMNIKLLQEEWGYNYSTDTNGHAVNWNNIKVLMMKKETPFSFYYKNSYKEEIYREVDVRNKRKKMKIISEITLQQAYTKRQELSENKKKDLRELLTKGLIPAYYASFYNLIIN